MQELQSILLQLTRDIKNNTKDHSLLVSLNHYLEIFKIESHLINSFIQVIFSLYDISNHKNLIKYLEQRAHDTNTAFQYDILSISIKLTVFKMLSSLVIYFLQNPNQEMPTAIFKQALQMMILIARLFIDTNRPYQVKECYHLVKTFFDTINFRPALEIEILHYLNMIEFIRLEIDHHEIIDFYQLKINLDKFYEKNKLGKDNYFKHYGQFVDTIVFEIILKMAKKGKLQEIKIIRGFLPKEMADSLSSILNFQDNLLTKKNNNIQVSPYYELYLQIKKGTNNISEERLRSFIQMPQNYVDERIFDVVALTKCLLPLEIWLQMYINQKNKCSNISQCYRCFTHLVDKQFIISSPHLQDPQSTIIQKYHQKIQKLSSYIKISNLIMLSLLLQKKQTQEPILSIIKRILKVLVFSILNIYPQVSQLRQFTQKINLVCSKFVLTDMTKMINIIWFYYEMILGTQTQESYNKFLKNNLVDKSLEIFKNIKTIYELKHDKMISGNKQEIQKLKKIPFLTVLFQKNPNESLILNIPVSQFLKCEQKFEVYFMLAKKYCQQSDINTKRKQVNSLIKHMEEVLIYLNFSKLTKTDLHYISLLQKIFLKIISQQNISPSTVSLVKVISLLLLYLYSINHFSQKLISLNTGILLNKYSKIIKIINFLYDQLETSTQLSALQKEEHTQIYKHLNKTILCYSLEEIKVEYQQNQQQIMLETGLLNLYEQLYSFIMKNEKQQKSILFIKFIRFQILSIIGQLSENDILFQKNMQLLKLFNSSKWINKNIKMRILKKLVKQNMGINNHDITLQQLNQLIMLTDNNQQKQLYTQHLINLFGTEGKQYLTMKSTNNPQLYQFLMTKDNEDYDDQL